MNSINPQLFPTVGANCIRPIVNYDRNLIRLPTIVGANCIRPIVNYDRN